jgi:hypothetical protein
MRKLSSLAVQYLQAMDIGGIFVYLICTAIGFVVLYGVIRVAVLHALREHTTTSVTAVMVRETPAKTPATDD